jgi:hypothetical protein
LNIIYPTPPTPLQQFSPLNANPILAEDPQAKRRRLAESDEYSEAEQDEENETDQKISGQTGKQLNKFLSVENLAAVSHYFQGTKYKLLFTGLAQNESSDIASLQLKEVGVASVQ